MVNHDDDDLAQALAVASDRRASTRLAGAAAPESRGIWSRMNLKVKILALAIPLGAALALHPLHPPAGPSVQHLSAPPASLSAPPPTPAPSPSLADQTPRHASPSEIMAGLLRSDQPLDSYGISSRLADTDPFAALATAVESFKDKPYFDSGGLNVGMGYCVTKRMSEYGAERVRSDLASAGFSAADIETLVKGKRSAQQKITVTPVEAAVLIDATRGDYMALARDAIGADVFDRMAPNRQAAMAYMAYNTGDVGQFKQLVSGLRSGSDSKAMLNMTVSWRGADGEVHANHRLRSYVQAMFLGLDHFKRAVADPNAFEGSIASPGGESALADVAAAAQKPNGLQSKLLAQRLRSNPWAWKAATDEQKKIELPAARGL